MQSNVSETFSSVMVKNKTCIVDGYGIHIKVKHNQLIVSDGVGRYRRVRKFSRATANIDRLVVLGHAGKITLKALRWLVDVGISFAHIDRDGKLLATTCPLGLNNATLRRAQALATSRPIGTQITKYIIREKLKGQHTVLANLPATQKSQIKIESALCDVQKASSLDSILFAESYAAAAYWNGWAEVQINFVRADQKRVHKNWHIFGQRSSPLSKSPRLAANPINALLNYLYAIVAAETRIACLSMGLDPGLGFFHADQEARDSLVLDLMEVIRPDVDLYVFRLLTTQVFRAKDFVETARGNCRISPPLSHQLAETASTWKRLAAPVVERVTKMLCENHEKTKRIPTPLTQSNRSVGRADGRKRSNPKAHLTPTPRMICLSCGEKTPNSERQYCDGCLPDFRAGHLTAFQDTGPKALAEMRAKGVDPTHGGPVAKKRGQTISLRRRKTRKWEKHNAKPDRSVFTKDILPLIKEVPIKKLAAATGLSARYCSLIRRGEKMPHPMYWDTLKICRK